MIDKKNEMYQIIKRSDKKLFETAKKCLII